MKTQFMMNLETLQFEWRNCYPGNMPEDLFPEAIQILPHNGNQYIGPFIGVNPFNKTESYCICSRYKKKNSDRWTWSGLHPQAWSIIPKFNSNTENGI